MSTIKEDVVKLLNDALALEHAARIQYLAHAELVRGLNAEKIIERLTEIAGDEAKHQEKFRTLIGDYLFDEPTMAVAKTHQAEDIPEILEQNLRNEKEAIDLYKLIYKKIVDNKDSFQYEFEMLEHEIRHIIVDEEEHVAELLRLLGK